MKRERTSSECDQNSYFQTTQDNERLTLGSLTLGIGFGGWGRFMFGNTSDGMTSRGDDFFTTFGAPMLAETGVGGLEANLA